MKVCWRLYRIFSLCKVFTF